MVQVKPKMKTAQHSERNEAKHEEGQPAGNHRPDREQNVAADFLAK
jgi:hypothetical protein